MKLIKLIKNLFKKPSVYDELMEIRKANEANLPHPVEIIESTIDFTKYLTNHPKQFKKLNYYKSELITKVPKYVQFEKLGLAQELLDKNKHYHYLSVIESTVERISTFESILTDDSMAEAYLLQPYNSAIMAAKALCGNLYGVMYYLYYGDSINSKDEEGCDIITYAITNISLDILIFCLAHKAELPTVIPNSNTLEIDDELNEIVKDMSLEEYVNRYSGRMTCQYLLFHNYVERRLDIDKSRRTITKKSTKEEDIHTLKIFARDANITYKRSSSIYDKYIKKDNSIEEYEEQLIDYNKKYEQHSDFRKTFPNYEYYIEYTQFENKMFYEESISDVKKSQEKLISIKKKIEDKYGFSFDKDSTYVELIAQFKQIIS